MTTTSSKHSTPTLSQFSDRNWADPATDTRALGSGVDEAHGQQFIEPQKKEGQGYGREHAVAPGSRSLADLTTDTSALGPEVDEAHPAHRHTRTLMDDKKQKYSINVCTHLKK